MAMTLRLSEDEDRALTLLARAQGVSKHDAAVRAIVSSAARKVRHEHVAQLARTRLAEFRDAEARLRR